MVSRTGPTKPALVLLCCMGTWLSIHTSPIGTVLPCDVRQILKNLESESENVFKDYKKEEPKLQNSTMEKCLLPCFTPGQQASENISVIRAHFEKVYEFRNNQTDIGTIIKRLDDLRYHNTSKPDISVPRSDMFQRKCFIMTVLREFSECMKTTYKAYKERLVAEGRNCPVIM